MFSTRPRRAIFTDDEENGRNAGLCPSARRGSRRGGPGAARRRHRDRGGRRLLAEGAAPPPRRPDHAARRRPDLDRLGRAAAEAGNDLDRVRPPRLGRHHRAADLLLREADRDDDEDRPQALPRRDRRQRLRQGPGEAARTGPLPRLLADHPLQRAEPRGETRRSSPMPT